MSDDIKTEKREADDGKEPLLSKRRAVGFVFLSLFFWKWLSPTRSKPEARIPLNSVPRAMNQTGDRKKVNA